MIGLKCEELVARLVDGADRDFQHRHARLASGDQHFQFEFVTASFEVQQACGEGRRDAAQSGLCVLQVAADHHLHQLARQNVTDAAAQGNAAIEAAGSHDERRGILQQAGGDAFDILGMMLPVGVRGNDSDQAGEVAERVIDTGFERGAFAEVDGVAQYVHAGQLRRLFENGSGMPGRCRRLPGRWRAHPARRVRGRE